jgi:glyoxylase-like metal-dependent hydrolase (beta-lactamase superfamily II)/ferredoxin
MADRRRIHPQNAPGAWFVDETCIDCDACRQVAPGLFEDVRGGSAVVRQPGDEVERRRASLALLACPVGAIGVTGERLAAGAAPELVDEDEAHRVYFCAYNARASYGANAWLVEALHPGRGNVLIDSPRFVKPLERFFEERGGIEAILLTHRDDVADAARWATRFGARVFIHADDRGAAPFASDIVEGRAPVEILPGVLCRPVPGHTKGSVLFQVDERLLFTGDSLHFSRARGTLAAFRDACWYSWEEQARSLATLVDVDFEWTLPGHGQRHRAEPAENRRMVKALVERMQQIRRPGLEGAW